MRSAPRLWHCALVAASLTLPIAGISQDWDVFDMTNAGFPSNSVKDIAIDGAGVVWVATDWGLCRYDGTNWQTLQTDNSGLPENTIQCLAVDGLDRLWIGTLMHGAVMYDGTTWTAYDHTNSGMPDDQVRSITIDYRNWAWIGTYLGVACLADGEWRIYNDQPDSYDGLVLNGPVIEDVAVRDDGLVAIATLNGGFHYLTDTCVHAHTTFTDFFPDNTQVAVAFDPNENQRWIATPSHGLIRHFDDWHSGLYFVYSTQTSNIPTNGLTSLAIDDFGRPWMGSNYAGICFRDGNGEFTTYNSLNSGLPDNTISSLAFAEDGSLWVGTFYGGAAHLTFTDGVAEQGKSSAQVFPNPAEDEVRVYWPSEGTGGGWQLIDGTGRTTANGLWNGTNPQCLRVAAMGSGSYILEMRNKVRRSFARLIVR